MTQEEMKHLLSFQGNEVRKMVTNLIGDYIKLKDLNPAELSKTITSIKAVMDTEGLNIKNLTDIVTANKNAISRNKQEILDTIGELNTSNDKLANERLLLLKSALIEAMSVNSTTLEQKIDEVKKELLLEQKLNVFELCNVFTRSLYNYSDYICTMDKQIGEGVNSLRVKLSGDHFNPKSSAYDNNIGNPRVKLSINDKAVYDANVQAVKIYNQYEYVTVNTDEVITDVKVEFITDAYEGGIDNNKDGLAEDRNLYVFELILNGNKVESDKINYIVGNDIKKYQEVMPWSGYLYYKTKEGVING